MKPKTKFYLWQFVITAVAFVVFFVARQFVNDVSAAIITVASTTVAAAAFAKNSILILPAGLAAVCSIMFMFYKLDMLTGLAIPTAVFSAFAIALVTAFVAQAHANEHGLRKKGMLFSCVLQFPVLAIPMLYVV